MRDIYLARLAETNLIAAEAYEPSPSIAGGRHAALPRSGSPHKKRPAPLTSRFREALYTSFTVRFRTVHSSGRII